MGRDEFLEVLRDPRYAILFLKERICQLTDKEAVELAYEFYLRQEVQVRARRLRKRGALQTIAR